MPSSTALPYVPRPRYGRDLLSALSAEAPQLFARPIVLTQPEPWQLVEAVFDPSSTQRHLVETMEHDAVRQRSDAFEEASAVFGVGGGSALDHAKYVAWRRGLPLVLVPSILSVDAAYTRAIGVREGARVRYVGDARPQALLVDFMLLQAAPPLLNRAGVGDILSIYTALWDWRAAHEALGEPWDAGLAADAEALLARLFEGADAIGAVSEPGLQLLSELYAAEVALCERWGNARPEEGSEHYIAYALEAHTGDHYVHGQLIGLTVALAAQVQGQDVERVVGFLRRVGLDCRPAAVGVDPDALARVLGSMRRYVEAETQLLPGVFHLRQPLEDAEIGALLALAGRLGA